MGQKHSVGKATERQEKLEREIRELDLPETTKTEMIRALNTFNKYLEPDEMKEFDELFGKINTDTRRFRAEIRELNERADKCHEEIKKLLRNNGLKPETPEE